MDNYYLIEDQIRLAQKYLPKGYSRGLPNLTKGSMEGYPRVYDIAMEVVSHGDGRVDIKGLSGFVKAYQSKQYLKLGELWGIPIMLRLALIENLRRVSSRLILTQIDRDKADYWAGRILDVSAQNTNEVIHEIAAMAKDNPPMSDSFVSEFVRRLQGQSSTLTLPLIWLEKRLFEQGETIERLIQSTSRKHAANQVSIANTIESLRVIESSNWHDFVDEASIVEHILEHDPSGDYPGMSFETRNDYRGVIEKLSTKTGIGEDSLAETVLDIATKAYEKTGKDDVTSHIGYYLMDKGLAVFYRTLGRNLPITNYLKAKKTTLPFIVYILSIFIITVTGTALVLWGTGQNIVLNIFQYLLLGFPLLFLISQTALSLVNWVVTLAVSPRLLPKMDLSKGIPANAHTLVVIPTMLSSETAIASLIENLEVMYMANSDVQLDFALLTDYTDALLETMPGDDALLSLAIAGIDRLNSKYPKNEGFIFNLFHRSRKWNPKEKKWMGYERKRGKISDLNALLRGKGEGRFSSVTGDSAFLQDVSYVITLDTDTKLPRNAARDLVAIIIHPLNRAKFDVKKQRIVSGYGILQPRVESSFPKENASFFVTLYGGEKGIDPYTKTVSDVYQDLFFEGSFIGKGLYDVDAFEIAIGDRFPENLILSHDMLEGCYARCGLVTDVQLYEEYPVSYLKDVNRRRRWIRGDWQIFAWLFPRVKDAKNKKTRNPISMLSKWKVFDNLRRSLVSISTVSLFVSGWIICNNSWLWTLFIIMLISLPIPLKTLYDFLKKPKGISFRDHLSSCLTSFSSGVFQTCLSLVFLVYEAYFNLDSIVRTVWRTCVSHKRLLEWATVDSTAVRLEKSIATFYKRMGIGPLVAFLCVVTGYSGADFPAIVILLGWFVSPAIALLISKPSHPRKYKLSDERLLFLRKLTRKTWLFFEDFVTEQDNFLPPDNFQEKPLGVVAHRTSPTNIGLSLLSNLTALDFGYISVGMMVRRSIKTLTTMSKMAKFKGHLFNWYDTQTLQPLEPKYVSSVDSGNLTGHLIVLRSGLTDLYSSPIVSISLFNGLSDTLYAMEDSINTFDGNVSEIESQILGRAIRKIIQLRETIAVPPVSLSEIYRVLLQLSNDISKIYAGLDRIEFEKIRNWGRSFEKQCYDYLEDILLIAPWILISPEIPGMWESGDEKQKARLTILYKELQFLDQIPRLDYVARLELKLLPLIHEIIDSIPLPGESREKHIQWFLQLKHSIEDAGTQSTERVKAIENAVLLCTELSNVEYDFLYDKAKNLMVIGYNVNEQKPDSSCYDLLASEARLASYVAIAQGRIPQEHWFILGRLLSKRGGDPVLISWGGSMFEYLMPLLIMPNFEGTLLDRTYKSVVSRQIDYGKKNNIPWGISESGYNKFDVTMSYQYHSFGVPDTGFKRGLSEDLVIAPYASVMGLMVETDKACKNLELLTGSGFEGDYGYYEAIDYTPSRLAPHQKHAVIHSYMAHHQGMSFLSLAYILLDKPMQKRFIADPGFKATELLLQEKIPDSIAYLYDTEVTGSLRKFESREVLLRVFTTANTPIPEIHLLSNGKYNVMITNSGGGYSRWKNLAVTRWREDAILDNKGTFIYVRNIETLDFWSTSYQPALHKSKKYEAVFSRSWAEFKRSDFSIDTHTKIAVSPEDDIELRRVTITNRSRYKRTVELTSYAEVVLNDHQADVAHTTFSNLFVETEIIKSHQAIVCSRRPRSEKEKFPVMLHLMAVHGNATGDASYETDRAKFIGRTNTLVNPDAMQSGDPLSNSEGAVLDPIVSIRCTVVLEPQESAVVDYVTGMCDDRVHADKMMEKYRDKNLADRVFELSWTHRQVALQQINVSEADAQLFGRLSSPVVYANSLWRVNEILLRRNLRGQSDLWGYRISGDLPIVLVRIENPDNVELVTKIVHAHAFWQMNGLPVDVLIWNEDHSVYRDEMTDKIKGLIVKNSRKSSNQPGAIYVNRADQMSEEDKILMQSVARVILSDRAGSLEEQIDSFSHIRMSRPYLNPVRKVLQENMDAGLEERTDLVYYNGYGGFTRDGREYVIHVRNNKKTPAPWVNVLANKDFGTVISESGSGYTWSENAHEFRLTPWGNDPVTDVSGEAIYIRDEETGVFWSPSPFPAQGESLYISRHGFGYSIFEHLENGIFSELTVFVSLNHPVKFQSLKIRNNSGRKRSLSVTSYNELVMGTEREKYHMHIQTEIDPKSGALFATNHYNKEFPLRVVFMDTSENTRFVSGDRDEFLGRNGSLNKPKVMYKDRLSGKTGAGLDPCVSMQVKFDIYDSNEKDVTFSFGAGKNHEEARAIVQQCNSSISIQHELEAVWDYWKRSLGVVYVETPDDSINFIVNGWLQYQIISCRLWGRSGFYQSGGAYGFRDQLQDVMALTYSHPAMVREKLLQFAAHQFTEGDVLHWWHPPLGRGIRSHCSDDFLWLAFVTCLYVDEIGDTGVLDEIVQFLDGPPVNSGEESNYGLPGVAEHSGTLYEHCVIAVKNALKFGVHALPLMGGGDWNDGMNLVGHEGKGESVWLAFFLYKVLTQMSTIAHSRGDMEMYSLCMTETAKLSRNIETNAWDGTWYLRAFYDNGESMGSSQNTECRIDALPQSWSVISGAVNPERCKVAMEQVDTLLVDRENALIKLFSPPFDKGNANPGYIKGYVPGVRENGGQYTHAAVWTTMAFALLQDKNRAWELLNMINPVNHGDTAEKCDVYKVEPYVMAADVYGGEANAGRGGWTWYTGSASWMYQLIVKHLLGLKLEVDTLYFKPCLPDSWLEYKLHYKFRQTFYHITIKRSGKEDNVISICLDGVNQSNCTIPLNDDGMEHAAEVVIG
ncbi:MAG TPA: cyclic beta 1-2 glucan synthetase [Spirochaetia bacterium]|nr:cyclic beta 1-2 glucan synthetase [Spirochaetia bacterium]